MPKLKTNIEKLFYPIGEVAQMYDVNISLIRFWENEFEILKPKKNKKGNRMFTKKRRFLKITKSLNTDLFTKVTADPCCH